jgi:hypothetical protein
MRIGADAIGKTRQIANHSQWFDALPDSLHAPKAAA